MRQTYQADPVCEIEGAGSQGDLPYLKTTPVCHLTADVFLHPDDKGPSLLMQKVEETHASMFSVCHQAEWLCF